VKKNIKKYIILKEYNIKKIILKEREYEIKKMLY